MKVEVDNEIYRPITITLETYSEAKRFMDVLNTATIHFQTYFAVQPVGTEEAHAFCKELTTLMAKVAGLA